MSSSRKRLTAAIAVCLGIGIAVVPVRAYDVDTHYYFTFFLARLVGYTPLQAYRIASATVGVDESPETEPLQKVNSLVGNDDTVYRVRIKFHAFQDEDRFGLGDSDAGRLAIEGKAAELWDQAKGLNNPGVYLHFYQDTFSHDRKTYGARAGHLRDGHLPDFLDYNHSSAEGVARGTIEKLTAFMGLCCPLQKPLPVNFDRDVRPVLDGLMEVNPLPLRAFVNLGQPLASPNFTPGPDYERAYAVVRAALADRPFAVPEGLSPMPHYSKRLPYNFDEDGNPAPGKFRLDKFGLGPRLLRMFETGSLRDSLVLSGTLFVRFTDQDGKPVAGVSARVILEPNIDGSGGTVLDERSEGSDVNGDLKLDGPVGHYRLVVSQQDYLSQPVEVTLDEGHLDLPITMTARPKTTDDGSTDRDAAPGHLTVSVTDVDTGQRLLAAVRAETTTKDGQPRVYNPESDTPLDVIPGFYKVSARTDAHESVEQSVNVRPGETISVDLRLGKDRDGSVIPGATSIVKEIGDLISLKHVLLSNFPPVFQGAAEWLTSMKDAVQRLTTLLKELGRAAEAACEASGRPLLSETDVADVERDAARVEFLLTRATASVRACRGPEALRSGEEAFGEATRLAAQIELRVSANATRNAMAAMRNKGPSLDEATRLWTQMKEESLPATNGLLEPLANVRAFNQRVAARIPALRTRLETLNGLVSKGTARGERELEAIARARDALNRPVAITGPFAAPPEAIDGLTDLVQLVEFSRGATDANITRFKACRASAAGATPLDDRLDTAKTLASLAFATLGEGWKEAVAACSTRLAAAPAARGASPPTPMTTAATGTATATKPWVYHKVDPPAFFFRNTENPSEPFNASLTRGKPPQDSHGLYLLADGTGGVYHTKGELWGPYGDEAEICAVLRAYGKILILYGNGPNYVACPKDGPTAKPTRVAEASNTAGAKPANDAGLPGTKTAGFQVTHRGTAYAVSASNPNRPLASQDRVRPGETLRTGPDGQASLQINAGTSVTVGRDTEVRVPPPAAGGSGQPIDVTKGLVEVIHEGPASFEDIIRTPQCEIRPKGTRYRVQVDEQGTTVEVLEGIVQLTGTYIIRGKRSDQFSGKRSPVRELELHPGESAMAMLRSNTADRAPDDLSATPPVATVPTWLANGQSPRAPSPTSGTPAGQSAGSAPVSSVPSWLGSSASGGAATAGARTPFSQPDPWNSPEVQRLLDQWVHTAVPPSRPGIVMHYNDWAQPLSQGAIATSNPEHPADWSRYRYLWENRTRYTSVNLCTIGEFVERSVAGQPPTSCGQGGQGGVPSWLSGSASTPSTSTPQSTPSGSSTPKTERAAPNAVERARAQVAQETRQPVGQSASAQTQQPAGTVKANFGGLWQCLTQTTDVPGRFSAQDRTTLQKAETSMVRIEPVSTGYTFSVEGSQGHSTYVRGSAIGFSVTDSRLRGTTLTMDLELAGDRLGGKWKLSAPNDVWAVGTANCTREGGIPKR